MTVPGGSEVKASAWNAGDWVRSLGQEDPLEKETATHYSTLAWRIPWREESGRLLVHGVIGSSEIQNWTFEIQDLYFVWQPVPSRSPA